MRRLATLWRLVLVFPGPIASLRELSHEEFLVLCQLLWGSIQVLNQSCDEAAGFFVEAILREG